MRIKNLISEGDGYHNELAWAQEKAAEVEAEKNATNGMIAKIKAILKNGRLASYKFKVDIPKDGNDDSDLATFQKDADTADIKDLQSAVKLSNDLTKHDNSLEDVIDVYKGAKPLVKYRLWKPTDDAAALKDYFKKVFNQVKSAVAGYSPSAFIKDLSAAFSQLGFPTPKHGFQMESIKSNDIDTLLEQFLSSYKISKQNSQTIKLKELLK